MYKKILIPLDGSKLAEKSLSYAIWLAQKSNAKLIVTHVYRRQSSSQTQYLNIIAKKISTLTHSNPGNQSEPEVGIEALAGDPATEILKYIDDKQIDLIVMSTHGHSGVRHWLLGSVADRVVRYSKKPVRLVKSFNNIVSEPAEYDQSIVALLDGSDIAEQILPYAAYHAGLSGGELVILSVCEPPDIIPAVTYHLIPDSYPPKRPIQWEKYVKEETERREKECRLYLEQNLGLNKANNFKMRYEFLFGNAADEITRYLEANPPSLVAMTTRGRSGLARWVYGSVAEKVLAVSKSPLLIMRPK